MHPQLNRIYFHNSELYMDFILKETLKEKKLFSYSSCFLLFVCVYREIRQKW